MVGSICLCVLTFRLSLDHRQGKVRRHTSPNVPGSAGVDSCILELGVVYNQLADVSDHNVPSHMIGFHDHVLFAFQLFLPGDFR